MKSRKGIFIELLCLLAICVAVALTCDVQHSLFLPPTGAHTWRQCDGASYAINYYQNHRPLFQPQNHNLNGDNGNAVSEFPIVYFLTGKLYSAFGVHEYFLRSIHGLLFLLGIVYTWLLARQYLKGSFFSLLPPIFLLTSPYLFYYGPNFLPDVPALSLAIASFYYFVVYTKNANPLYLMVFAVFAILACLLKISAGILPLTAISIWCLFQLNLRAAPISFNPIIRKQKLVPIVVFTLVIIIVAGWVQFAKNYNHTSHNGQNLLGLFPIWDASKEEIQIILTTFKNVWFNTILSPAGWVVLVVSAVLLGYNWRTMDKALRAYIVVCFLGIVSYSLCWFRAFNVHDYYLINIFCFPLLVVIGGSIYLEKWWMAKAKWKVAVVGLASVTLLTNALIVTKKDQWNRYYNASQNFKPGLMHISAYLRSIGIDRFQKVMVVTDNSPNVSLYFINNPGWTENSNWDQRILDNFNSGDCQYLIVTDSSYLNKDLYKPYLKKHVGYCEGINIYDTRK